MLAGIGGGEGEFALTGTALRDDAVVVVKRLLNCDEYAGVWFRLEGFGRIVPYFGVIVACASSVLPNLPPCCCWEL